MPLSELEERVGQLEAWFRSASHGERQRMRPEVQKVIRQYRHQFRPLPPSLRRLEQRMEEDALDDMFDNLPV
ncbi:MAG: hypothetical protein AAF744_09425 [Pseudomonadota bacterium]